MIFPGKAGDVEKVGEQDEGRETVEGDLLYFCQVM